MRETRRPWWLWVASTVVALLGAVAGGAIYIIVSTVWFAFQPKSHVLGWGVPIVLGVISLLWLGATILLARMHTGRSRWIFLGITLTVGAVSFATDMIPTTTDEEVLVETLSPDEAEAWSKLAK